MRNARIALAVLCAAALACVAAGGVSAASVPAVKKHPKKTHVVAKKKPARKHHAKKKAKKTTATKAMCLLGQAPAYGDSCTPNPLLAKTACAAFVPSLQALAPGFQFPAGYDHGAGPGGVACWWTVNGERQAFSIGVAAAVGWKDQQGNPITPQQAFDTSFQAISDGRPPVACSDGTTVPSKTTVDGLQAFFYGVCPGSEQKDIRNQVTVLDGKVLYTVLGDSLMFHLSCPQLVPLVRQVIAEYQKYAP